MHKLPLPAALALATAGGLLTNGAFPSNSWWWAAPVGLGLLLLALRGVRPGRGFLLGTLWGFAFFGPLIAWALVSVSGHWLPWLALSLLQAAFIGLFGALFALVTARVQNVATWVLAGAVLWVAVEQFRAAAPFGGFPWGVLAFSQVDGPLLRLAPWGGTVVVSLVVAVVAGALAGLVTLARRPRPAAVAAGVAVVLVGGAAFIPLPSAAPETGTVDIAMFQASVPERGASWQSQGALITAEYSRMTQLWAREGHSVDMVLWPESAADLDPRDYPDVRESVMAAQAAVGVPVLFGTQRYPGDGTRFNEYLVWTEVGPIDVYAKQHPVPFGEYMPMRDFFRRLSSAVDRVSADMVAGQEPGILHVPVAALERVVIVGVAICFEVSYDEIFLENVREGAEFLVVPTNNASFGFTQETFQQRDMTRFRAVEFGRAAVQVATTGVTAVYAPDGQWLNGSTDELYSQWSGNATIPLRTTPTFTQVIGATPRLTVWSGAVIWLVAALIGARRNRGKEDS